MPSSAAAVAVATPTGKVAEQSKGTVTVKTESKPEEQPKAENKGTKTPALSDKVLIVGVPKPKAQPKDKAVAVAG